MINVRPVSEKDIQELKAIHEKFYKEEFDFDNTFAHNFLCGFIVEDNDGSIISTGGVRAICESVIITDKDKPVETRRDALINIMRRSVLACKENNFNQLHAFVQDENFLRHLKKAGFVETRGSSLVLEF